MAELENKRKVKSFSLNTDEDIDILNKLDEVGNISDYIKKLIREDLNNSNTLTKSQREEVKRIVIEILKDKAIEIKEEDIDNRFDTDAVELLTQFDDM